MIFLLASQNPYKKVEFARILEPLGITIQTGPEAGIDLPDVDETGTTFEENALLKAEAGCRISGLPTLSDDSGLCVDALDGAPGIYSARFSGEGGEHGDDAANNRKLLDVMKDVPEDQRTARYVAAIAAVFPDGRKFVVRGTCEGRIGYEERGEGGFGYDPLFLYGTEGDKTYAEVPAAVKDESSHRSVALHKMAALLKEELY